VSLVRLIGATGDHWTDAAPQIPALYGLLLKSVQETALLRLC
jgi:hypothetical protein